MPVRAIRGVIRTIYDDFVFDDKIGAVFTRNDVFVTYLQPCLFMDAEGRYREVLVHEPGLA